MTKAERIETLRRRLTERSNDPEAVAALDWLDTATYRLIDLDEIGLAVLNAEELLRRSGPA